MIVTLQGQLFRVTPVSSTQYHRHVCAAGCGDYYVCSRNPDQCPTDWTCDGCAMDQMDDYYRQEQEANRADHRKG